MRDLPGMSAHLPASITLSLNEFARHGDLPGIEDGFKINETGFAVPVGNTDSEYAFCLLMQPVSEGAK